MKKSHTIFGSNSELRAFESIDRHLPEGWRLFANTPLPQIVEVGRNELLDKQWDFYLKTSVDFVLSNRAHQPALAIEFDGLGEGYSASDKYVLERPVDVDPYRELKTNFKLHLCSSVGLPLIVISFEEIKDPSGTDLLSIVNSMIGTYIATREYRSTIEEWDRKGRGRGKTFEQLLWEDSVLRTELSFKYDPALMRIEQLSEAFEKLNATWSMTSMSRPDQMTVLREGSHFTAVGCRQVVEGGVLKTPVIAAVWVRNFAGKEMGPHLDSGFIPTHGINPLKVAENIAWYLSHKRALEVAGVLPT